MTTPAVSKKTGFFANEPQVVQGLVLWVLTQVGAFLIGHTHLVTSDEWGTVSSTLVPIISTAVIALVTFAWRRWLSPAWKVVDSKIDSVPFGSEVEKVVEAKVEEYLQKVEGRFPTTEPVSASTSTLVEVPVDKVDGSPTVGTPAPGESNGAAQAG